MRGSQVDGVQVDVMNRESLEAAGEAINERFGTLYGLVNAAGGNSPKATVSPTMSFFDIPEDGMRFVLDLNILGTIMPCQILAKQMVETGEGVILNYSSMNAYRPLTNIAAYSASKAAITNFTAWLAVHLAQNYSGKIRVNAIAPGFFLGEQNRFLMIDKDTGGWTARGQKIIDHTPMGRFGNPEDLLGACSGCFRRPPRSSRASPCRWTAASRRTPGCNGLGASIASLSRHRARACDDAGISVKEDRNT